MPHCPAHYQSLDIAEAVRSYFDMDQHNVLPIAGGMLDQTSHFVRFARVFGGELQKIRMENKS